ncbi:MAG TPA: YifB family Mg chelatase-like AAA ATPase [Thermoanaerobaculia bacterium]|nr:YifB family Mg chelatase-like AAA ATPase [Thermoanaerobaculia bacterium]
MLARAVGATPWGIDALPVEVEVESRFGLPGLQLVGLADAAVRESRERMRSAIRNTGIELPSRSVVINLAPADLRKEGNHLDLAITVGYLAAHGQIPLASLDGRVFCGELGLDGALRPVRGALAIAALARSLRAREVLLPADNAAQAACLAGTRAIPIRSLAEAVEHLTGAASLEPALPAGSGGELSFHPDLAEVRGQAAARRALEVAAAGGHNLLLCGPPGSGKTMLARRMPGLLPELQHEEAILVTKIHSLATDLPALGLITARPFRSPHAGVSTAGLIGGGPVPRPGEVTLAHGGVLFLDELPEFRRDTLEALRQPLEDGSVSVVRAKARVVFPSRFVLLAAMNPCPCGYHGDSRHDCRCPPSRIDSYRGRISGPLLDRIDLQIEVPPVALRELQQRAGESSAAVARRVGQARERQRKRWAAGLRLPALGEPQCNAFLPASSVDELCRPEPAGRQLLERAYDKLGLSVRAVHRVLRVARTLADLGDTLEIAAEHVAEALQYRLPSEPSR